LCERGDYLLGQATALYRLGDARGDNAALRSAIEVFRDALEKRTRERVPLDWAMTQNNLGNALATLGQRENGTERLLEAVVAYRDALEERTRERVPLQWAMTQNNLGTAQTLLNERLELMHKSLEFRTGRQDGGKGEFLPCPVVFRTLRQHPLL
jgi:tetratricopeptide (TPR) repeat protein